MHFGSLKHADSTMTSFEHNYRNLPRFCFLMQNIAVVMKTKEDKGEMVQSDQEVNREIMHCRLGKYCFFSSFTKYGEMSEFHQ